MRFGAIITQDATLNIGSAYTFTFAHGRVFEYNSTDDVRGWANDFFSQYANIISLDRPLFSDHYVITMSPLISMQLSDWVGLFQDFWQTYGYNSVSLVTAEIGIGSSQPGGIVGFTSQISSTIGQSTSNIVGGALTPILPYLFIGVAAYLAIKIGPRYLSKRR